MSEVVRSGTGKNVKLGIPVYAKTGTSQAFRDGWFIGYTGDIVAGVWIGNDNESPMKKVTGGTLPAAIWEKVIIEARRVTSVSKRSGSIQSGPVLRKKSFWKNLINRIMPSN